MDRDHAVAEHLPSESDRGDGDATICEAGAVERDISAHAAELENRVQYSEAVSRQFRYLSGRIWRKYWTDKGYKCT